MFNKELPSVVFVVDASGSMRKHAHTVNAKLADGLFPEFGNGINANLGTIYFDDHVPNITWGKQHAMRPNGETDLYGACVKVLEELRAIRGASDKCLVIVVTDGGHNWNSRSLTAESVKSEVSIAEDILGWDFLFVGTNQDANRVGSQLGIKPGKALSFAASEQGFELMLDTLKDVTTKWVSGNLAHESDFFTPEVKEQQRTFGAVVL